MKPSTSFGDVYNVQTAAIERLEAELARLRAENTSLLADAERYRWLKANRLGETLGDDGTLCIEFYCDFEHYNDVDAAIDKARKP